MHWRVGLDLGSNSIGWWAFEVENQNKRWVPVRSIDGGCLIFSDGREPSQGGRVGDSLAVSRRLARGMRRNRDHGRNRIKRLVKELIKLGLLPEDKTERDALFQTKKKALGDPDEYNPYRLRSEALERPLTPHELGRALFHLGIRRGYKSNRKEASDDDGGKLKERIEALRATLGNRTLGQYLWDKFQAEKERERSGENPNGIRFRADSEIYPERSMVEDEFNRIKEVQQPHHSLTEDDWGQILSKSIVFQWPLKPVERGACEFFVEEPRHWSDTPIGHDFRIYQELNALRVENNSEVYPLDAEQRSQILDLLHSRKSEVKFPALRKLKRKNKELLFPKGSTFNLEGDKRKGLKPHKFAVLLKDDPALARLWSDRKQTEGGKLDDIFEMLQAEADQEAARDSLKNNFQLSPGIAEKLLAIPLSSGTASVSRKFMEQIVPVLKDQGLVYSDAVAELTDDDGNPLHHSVRGTGRTWEWLPYYGEVFPHSMLGADKKADAQQFPEKHFGKINNPTVHVALNQLRKLMNTLVERFGSAPVEVFVELTRDLKLSKKQRDEINKEQARNQRNNDRIAKMCQEHGVYNPSARDIKKVKLWEELGKDKLARVCVYSGKTISANQLFNGEVELEHILPFSRTLDDSLSNLTLSFRWVNRLKGNGTPYESFGQDQHAGLGIVWEDILVRAADLPAPKRRRFSKNAMANYEQDGGFIARQLTDTAYMSKLAQGYLRALDGVEQVVPTRGRLTGLLRGKWGLNGILSDDNYKTREDHRHHAVDAAVIALTDRSVLNEVSRLSARGADDIIHLSVPELDEMLREQISTRVPEIVVAHKPDHGLLGQMYKETAYGFIPPDRRDPEFPDYNLVARMSVRDLTAKQCANIRDPKIRADVLQTLVHANDHKAALAAFAERTGIKSVRVLVADQTVQPVPSAPYKGYKPDSYVCCDIWRLPSGKTGQWKKDAFDWQGVFWSYAETVQGMPDKASRKPHPAAKFVMRLFKDDVVSYKDDGSNVIMRVVGFSTTNNILDLRPQNLANPPRKFVSIPVVCRMGLQLLRVCPDSSYHLTKFCALK